MLQYVKLVDRPLVISDKKFIEISEDEAEIVCIELNEGEYNTNTLNAHLEEKLNLQPDLKGDYLVGYDDELNRTVISAGNLEKGFVLCGKSGSKVKNSALSYFGFDQKDSKLSQAIFSQAIIRNNKFDPQKDPLTIDYPAEITLKESDAIKMWGENSFIPHDVLPSDDPYTFAEKLVDGKIVKDPQRLEVVETEKQNMQKLSQRVDKINELKSAIDPNKNYDALTALERKLVFNIGGGPTDEELGL
jgi:hypothetical protein